MAVALVSFWMSCSKTLVIPFLVRWCRKSDCAEYRILLFLVCWYRKSDSSLGEKTPLAEPRGQGAATHDDSASPRSLVQEIRFQCWRSSGAATHGSCLCFMLDVVFANTSTPFPRSLVQEIGFCYSSYAGTEDPIPDLARNRPSLNLGSRGRPRMTILPKRSESNVGEKAGRPHMADALVSIWTSCSQTPVLPFLVRWCRRSASATFRSLVQKIRF